MILTDVIAALCNEPFNLRPDEVGRLTLFQIRTLYFRPRDDKGQIIMTPDPDTPPRLDRNDWNVTYCRVNHIPLWYAAKKLGIVFDGDESTRQ